MSSSDNVQNGVPYGHSYEEVNCSAKEKWSYCPNMLWAEIITPVLSGNADLEKNQARRRQPRSQLIVRHTAPKLLRLIIAVAIGGTIAMVLFQMLLLGVNVFREPKDPFDEVFHSKDGWERSRRTPLYAALGSGCISIETDIWLFDGDLYVGHDMESLTRDATLSKLYLEPLETILKTRNTVSEFGSVTTGRGRGVFSVDPDQNLVLLIDLKNSGAATYAHLDSKLSSLRNSGWLTHWNGTSRVERQITVVVSGYAPFDLLTTNATYRDIFFDAPLNHLDDPTDIDPSAHTNHHGLNVDMMRTSHSTFLGYKYNPSNSHYASADFRTVVGYVPQYHITPAQRETLAGYMRDAELRGLVPRYWATPSWPRNFRDHVWQLLLEENVGVLNVDDLRAARKGQWGDFTKKSLRK